ncbi:hypothetical protein BDQ17DRAFT_1257208 [Cyathus striatus]|nr:hypothetical protein BDQ17DRAFT_1257208 [Cyathus striatus]
MFIQSIKRGYPEDKLMSLIMSSPDTFPCFPIKDGIIHTNNIKGDEVTCIPQNRILITTILEQAHNIVGHFGDQHTAEYIHKWYWWPQLVKDTREFC